MQYLDETDDFFSKLSAYLAEHFFCLSSTALSLNVACNIHPHSEGHFLSSLRSFSHVTFFMHPVPKYKYSGRRRRAARDRDRQTAQSGNCPA